MEDALALKQKNTCASLSTVLILVLMEDALAHAQYLPQERGGLRLNPCFNGRCTRTKVNLSM